MKQRFLFAMAWLLAVAAFAQIPNGYYNSANGLSGDALKAALNDIIDGHTEFPYTSSSPDVWDALKVLDQDPNNANNVVGIYSRFSIPAASEFNNGDGWNREHVWAKSRGDFGESLGPGTDLHHLRAADISTNSARSNRAFDNGGSTYVDQSGTYNGMTPAKSGSGTWEPGDGQKGDVARMLFYMATRYEGENGEVDLELTEEVLGNTDKQPLHGKLSTLLAWHIQDPVDDGERRRNDLIYSDFQGNRNPFIDHPEWVDAIWGEGSGESDPIISLSQTTINFAETPAGENAASQSYTVNGTDLQGDIAVSVSAPFELSRDNSNFSNSVTVAQAAAENGDQTVYVRFSPTVADGESFSRTISHASTGAATKTITVTGTEFTQSISDIAAVRIGSVGEEYIIRGVVTTPDYGSTDSQFFLQDATGGINVFYENNPGAAAYGNELEIVGTLGSFNNLLQIEPNSITVLNASVAVPDYEAITESALTLSSPKLGSRVRIGGVTLKNPSEWPTTASGSGTSVSAQVGDVDFQIRIDEVSFYNGSNTPSGELVVSGILTRFQNDVQIMPFFDGDVVESTVELPILSVNISELSFPDTEVDTFSSPLVITIHGENLEESVTVTVCCEFELSLTEDGSFTESVNLQPTNGSVNQNVFVRFSPTSEGNKSATLTITSSGESESIALSGQALAPPPPLPNAWISELHYNNMGADRDEFIEVYIENSQSYSLSDFQIELINGADESIYGSFELNTTTSGSEGYYFRNFGGIQNGPDAVKFLYKEDVLHFIAYGGSVGSAEVITMGEDDATPTGMSLQLCCSGDEFADMIWIISDASPGAPNVEAPLAIQDRDLFIYPNPTHGKINLEGLPEGSILARILTPNGILLLSELAGKDTLERKIEEHLRAAAPGLYVLELSFDLQVERIKIKVTN